MRKISKMDNSDTNENDKCLSDEEIYTIIDKWTGKTIRKQLAQVKKNNFLDEKELTILINAKDYQLREWDNDRNKIHNKYMNILDRCNYKGDKNQLAKDTFQHVVLKFLEPDKGRNWLRTIGDKYGTTFYSDCNKIKLLIEKEINSSSKTKEKINFLVDNFNKIISDLQKMNDKEEKVNHDSKKELFASHMYYELILKYFIINQDENENFISKQCCDQTLKEIENIAHTFYRPGKGYIYYDLFKSRYQNIHIYIKEELQEKTDFHDVCTNIIKGKYDQNDINIKHRTQIKGNTVYRSIDQEEHVNFICKHILKLQSNTVNIDDIKNTDISPINDKSIKILDEETIKKRIFAIFKNKEDVTCYLSTLFYSKYVDKKNYREAIINNCHLSKHHYYRIAKMIANSIQEDRVLSRYCISKRNSI